MKKVLIAIPCQREVPIEFMLSLMSLKTPEGCELGVVANSLVYMARKQLTLKAIEEGFEYILWLDSDTTFQRDTLVNMLECVEKNHLDYLAALMFTRAMPCEPIFYKQVIWERDPATGLVTDHGAEKYFDYPKDRVFSIGGSGMGCVLMKTSILKECAEFFGMSPFEPMPFIGEDLSLCWRLGKLGVRMYCDSRIKTGHVGSFVFDENTFMECKERTRRETND